MSLKDKYPLMYKNPKYDIVSLPNTAEYNRIVNGISLTPTDYYLVPWNHEIWMYMLENKYIEQEYYQRLDGTTKLIYVYQRDIDQVIKDFKTSCNLEKYLVKVMLHIDAIKKYAKDTGNQAIADLRGFSSDLDGLSPERYVKAIMHGWQWKYTYSQFYYQKGILEICKTHFKDDAFVKGHFAKIFELSKLMDDNFDADRRFGPHWERPSDVYLCYNN